jgi:NADPH-dependent 2,4-dienoyl-CoA reductase/sulfur reductase-like enzyme
MKSTPKRDIAKQANCNARIRRILSRVLPFVALCARVHTMADISAGSAHVVVIGGGLAGLSAALSAAASGACGALMRG